MSRSSSIRQDVVELLQLRAPVLLAIGLMVVTLGQLSSAVPMLVGVSLLMLGSTAAVTTRVRSPYLMLAVGVNLLIYLALYGLFLGALTNPGPMGIPASPAWLRLVDLGISAWLVVLSLQLGLRQLDPAR